MHFFQKLFKIVFRIPLLTYKWSHSINYKLILNYKCFKQDIYCSFATLNKDEEKYSTKGVDLAFKQIVVIMS